MVLVFILCGIIAMCVSGIYSCEDKSNKTDGTTCKLLSCGDIGVLLKSCSPTRAEFKRIVSVNLKRRSSAGSCGEPPGNASFGITPDGKEIWVSDYCYGTFCICFEKGKDRSASEQLEGNETTTDEALIHSSTNGITNNAGYETTDQANDTSEAESYQTETIFTPTEENVNVTDASLKVTFTEDISNTSQNSAGSTLSDEIPSRNHLSTNALFEKDKIIDPDFKLVLIALISGGGFILIVLIIAISILCRKRKRKITESQPRAFRGQNFSSSYLVSSELVNESNLYESIPADRSRPLRKNIQRLEGKRHDHEYFILAKSDISDISEPLQRHEHEYFMLAPEVCKFCPPTVPKDDINIYSRIQENGVYDHLVSVPRASVSEASTYDHLWSFDRERKGTVCEGMGTQTGCMESG